MSSLNSGKFLLTTSTSLLYKVRITGRATNYLDFFRGSSGNSKFSSTLLSEKKSRQVRVLQIPFYFSFYSSAHSPSIEEDGNSEPVRHAGETLMVSAEACQTLEEDKRSGNTREEVSFQRTNRE